MARLQLQFGNRMRELRNHRITMQEQISREMEEEGNVGMDDFLLDALESVVDSVADSVVDQATAAIKLSKATKSMLDVTDMFDDNSPSAKKRRKGDKKPSIGLVGTVRWAVTWMRANYAHDLMMCCLFIIYGAVYAGGLPLMMEYLFDTALPNMQKGYPCMPDVVSIGILIVLTALIQIWIDYKLMITKMDGSGFVPLIQKQLAQHISQLPQTLLDGLNETEASTHELSLSPCPPC